jgi:hypothetical protein
VRARAAAATATLLALGAAAGTATYVLVSDDRAAPRATTTTTTTAEVRAPTAEALAVVIVRSLQRGLEVPLDHAEARCIGTALLAAVGSEEAEAWLDGPAPPLTRAQREVLVRAVVRCVPEQKALALLGDPTTTTFSEELPDE